MILDLDFDLLIYLHVLSCFVSVFIIIVSVGTYLGKLRFDELAYFLLAVGTFLGAMTGAFIGQETESGFIRGAAVGAMSGAVFSIEVFEYSLNLWRSNESGIDCLLYLVSHFVKLYRASMCQCHHCIFEVYCIYAD